MPSYERKSHVDADLETVWDFHSRVSGLRALTPEWLHLRTESVVGPDGESNPGVLEAGSTITMSIRPGGVGPRQYWTSRITDRERTDGVAYFRDEMVDGPFDRWEHVHAFYADDGGTLLRDHVEYELPFGPLGDALEPFSPIGFEGMFRTRHERTKELLDGRGRERERDRNGKPERRRGGPTSESRTDDRA